MARKSKVEKVLGEFKRGELHSGRGGPRVKSRSQAIAIALSEARRAGERVPPRPKAQKGGTVMSEHGREARTGKRSSTKAPSGYPLPKDMDKRPGYPKMESGALSGDGEAPLAYPKK